jgi:GntR family transcriptional regulator
MRTGRAHLYSLGTHSTGNARIAPRRAADVRMNSARVDLDATGLSMTARTNTRTGIARYQQVYTVLSQALSAGNIAAGEALPSEPTLVRQYGVSRTTVRRALARLAADGSIVRRRGSGTFAKNGLEKAGATRKVTRLLDDLRRVGSNTRSQLLSFERVSTPSFVLREWPEFGGTALLIRRLRSVGDDPVVLATIYVPEELAPLLDLRRAGGDAVLVALDKLGHRAVIADQQTNAVAADPFSAEHLRCPVGAALLNVRQLARDAKGRIMDFTNFVYRPDCYELHVQIDRGQGRRTRVTR